MPEWALPSAIAVQERRNYFGFGLEGHLWEWQMSVPEGGCFYAHPVCKGRFLKNSIEFLLFRKTCHVYEKNEISFLMFMKYSMFIKS